MISRWPMGTMEGVTQTSRPGGVRERDLYRLLGVEPGATTEEIAAAFRAQGEGAAPRPHAG